jgi:hypothetical protein
MKTKLVLIIALLGLAFYCPGQTAPDWNKWNWLIGDWLGAGGGVPGQGAGSFSFTLDLGQNILVRKSHSEYPATGGKPPLIHDDLMIVHADQSGTPVKAIYFDNEGHTINYAIAYADGAVILTSEKNPPLPIFRLTYTRLDDETVHTEFAMSKDGEKFTTYVEGKSKRKR